MGQRLVLRAKDEVSIGEIADFAKKALEYGLTNKEGAKVSVGEDGSLRLIAELPAGVRVVAGKKHVIRPQTKKQVRVKQHVEEAKEKKANGESVGHVPPVDGPKKQRKVKCPVCNVRKPVVKRSGISVIKPHVVKGEECSGSGEQVTATKKRSASGGNEVS